MIDQLHIVGKQLSAISSFSASRAEKLRLKLAKQKELIDIYQQILDRLSISPIHIGFKIVYDLSGKFVSTNGFCKGNLVEYVLGQFSFPHPHSGPLCIFDSFAHAHAQIKPLEHILICEYASANSEIVWFSNDFSDKYVTESLENIRSDFPGTQLAAWIRPLTMIP